MSDQAAPSKRVNGYLGKRHTYSADERKLLQWAIEDWHERHPNIANIPARELAVIYDAWFPDEAPHS